jgi:hypothetical protein
MKKLVLFSVLLGSVLALFSGCATTRTSSAYERSTETRMIVIQEMIEDGQKTGALTPDQSRMYLETLKDIQTDYAGLRGKSVSREERNNFQGRLDVLGDVVNKAITRTKKNEKLKSSFWERVGQDIGVLSKTEKPKEPTMGDRIIKLQKKIDDGRSGGAFSLKQGNDFQTLLDYVRSQYLLMMKGGRTATVEEKEVISRLLDSLETDLRQVPQL